MDVVGAVVRGGQLAQPVVAAHPAGMVDGLRAAADAGGDRAVHRHRAGVAIGRGGRTGGSAGVPSPAVAEVPAGVRFAESGVDSAQLGDRQPVRRHRMGVAEPRAGAGCGADPAGHRGASALGPACPGRGGADS